MNPTFSPTFGLGGSGGFTGTTGAGGGAGSALATGVSVGSSVLG
jgi:hypothetical protein